MPISDFVESTDVILAATLTRLRSVVGMASNHVVLFSGTDVQDMLDDLAAAKTPGYLVHYMGADRGDNPRRLIKIAVYCLTEVHDREQGAIEARDLLDSTFEKLDDYILDSAIWQYFGDEAITLPNMRNKVIYRAEFRVECN